MRRDDIEALLEAKLAEERQNHNDVLAASERRLEDRLRRLLPAEIIPFEPETVKTDEGKF